MTRVILTGGNGQLGHALQKCIPNNINLIVTNRIDLDLTNTASFKKFIREYRPDWLINAAAYTNVDKAEQEPDLARSINADAPEAFAQELAKSGGRILQISTDFVFSGNAGCPYLPNHPVDPIGAYGQSKALGEQSVLRILDANRKATVLRTSWIYGPVGNNFCLSMLRLHARRVKEGKSLGVVADQVGCPTSSHNLAQACWRIITYLREGKELPSILHWSDSGAATWYDFATAIGELGVAKGIIPKSAFVYPLRTEEYPTLAKRPKYSLLEISRTRELLNLNAIHWRTALSQVLEELSVKE